MQIVEEHTSPDGSLKLVVWQEGDDFIVGFDGFEWHTHGDLLHGWPTPEGDLPEVPSLAARGFVREILSNRAVIAVLQVEGKIKDVSITDDPEGELRHQLPEETIRFRYWDGSPLSEDG